MYYMLNHKGHWWLGAADGSTEGTRLTLTPAFLAASLENQSLDEGRPLVGDLIRPGTQPDWSGHDVDPARETAFYPQPSA